MDPYQRGRMKSQTQRQLLWVISMLPILSLLFNYSNAYIYVPTNNIYYNPAIMATIQRASTAHLRLSPSSTSSARSMEITDITSSPVQNPFLLLAALDDNNNINVDKNKPPPLQVRTQSQQMNDAMVLKTMRGTQWRIIEERNIGSTTDSGGLDPLQRCRAIATFRGFETEDNKGVVNVNVQCSRVTDQGSALTTNESSSSGRWVTKPSNIKRGSIQLSARWKVRLPEGIFIYKGYIQASKIMGKDGSPYDADMTGVILTGEDVNKEKVVGSFRGDFVKVLDDTEAEFVTTGGGGGSITLVPKE